jgi:hypothetical protein
MSMTAARGALLTLAVLLGARHGLAGPSELTELTVRPHAKILGAELAPTRAGVELVVASSEDGARGQRFLTSYALRDGKLVQLSQRRVPDDVVAWTLADFAGSGERRPVYLTARSVFALGAESDPPRAVLRDTRLLFSIPQPGGLPFWDGALDLDGDQRDDLVLPDPTGYGVYRQQPGGALVPAGRIEVDHGFETGSDPGAKTPETPGALAPLVSARRLRRLAPADVNGDRRIDFLALKDLRLFAFVQSETGMFGAAPSWERELARKSLGTTLREGDLNRDGRADFVLAETDTDELVTRLRIFLASETGLPDQPTQILKLSGLCDAPELVDVNGDGAQDLALLSVDQGFLQTLNQGKVSFSVQVFLFRADERRFGGAPDLDFRTTLDVSLEEGSQKGGLELARMLGDFDGDGLHDLVLLSNDRLRIHRVKRAGADRRLDVETSPAFTRTVSTSNVLAADLDANGRAEIVVVYTNAVDVLVAP